MNNNQKLHALVSKGKWNFILFKGVIAWGLMTAILFTIIRYFFNDHQYSNDMWVHFVVFPLTGLVWGHYMWLYFNNKYRSLDDVEQVEKGDGGTK